MVLKVTDQKKGEGLFSLEYPFVPDMPVHVQQEQAKQKQKVQWFPQASTLVYQIEKPDSTLTVASAREIKTDLKDQMALELTRNIRRRNCLIKPISSESYSYYLETSHKGALGIDYSHGEVHTWFHGQRQRSGGHAQMVKVLNAPMTGKIIRIACKVGEVCQAGATLMVIEAMKMENKIIAPRNVTISKIAVELNQSVTQGQLLFKFE